MEQPEYTKSAGCSASGCELDYGALMTHLTAGDINSAQVLCTAKPELTKLLIESGRLTSEELSDLIVVHQTDGLNELPLGTFFVYSGVLTMSELRAFLLLQKALRANNPRYERWGQKLVKAGLLTSSQLHCALSDRIAGNITLRQAILDRGYLTEEQLDRIF